VLPYAAATSPYELKQHINDFSRRLLVLYTLICLVVAISGYWMFPWVYGPSFSNMFVPFLLIIPGILAISGLYPYTVYFAGENRIGINIKGSMLAFVFILTADAIFIPKFGINAAAAISSVGYFVYYAYVYLMFKKEMNIEKVTVARDLVSGHV
jgi:O-antigen/teichoic acid export membrane protein